MPEPVVIDFEVQIGETNKDYADISAAEDALHTDLTSAETVVYKVNIGSLSGAIADGADISGGTNSYDADVLHLQENGQDGSYYILVEHDTEDEFFADGEVLDAGGGNTITLAAADALMALRHLKLIFYDDFLAGYHDDYVDFGTDWTASTDHKIIITVNEADRHDGTAESGFYWYSTNAGNYPGIIHRADYMEMEWVELQAPNATSANIVYHSASGDASIIQYCLFHNIANTNENLMDIFRTAQADKSDVLIKDTCIYDIGAKTLLRFNTLSNCVLLSQSGEQWGYYGTNNDEILLHTCACYNVVVWNGDSVHDSYGTFNSCTGDYNAGDDSSAPGAHSIDNLTLGDGAGKADFVNTAAGSEDFHLKGTTGVLYDAGDTTGDANSLTEDLDGDARAELGACDIGIDEYVSEEPPAGVVIFRRRTAG